MSKLITLSDIQAIKPISANTNTAKTLNASIIEAQDFDAMPLIGVELFEDIAADVLASPSLQTYEDLWNGSIYTYNGNKYKNYGLKNVICYYAYARFISNGQAETTAFGVVNKFNDDSRQVTEKTINRMVSQSISSARLTGQSVIDYLNRNKELYPLFKCSNKERRTSGVRITSIG